MEENINLGVVNGRQAGKCDGTNNILCLLKHLSQAIYPQGSSDRRILGEIFMHSYRHM